MRQYPPPKRKITLRLTPMGPPGLTPEDYPTRVPQGVGGWENETRATLDLLEPKSSVA